MRRLLIALAALGLSAPPAMAGGNEGWAMVGYDIQTLQPTAYIKLRNAEQINKDSFKVRFRMEGHDVLMKLNCVNKDLNFDGGNWEQITGGFTRVGEILCRFLPARESWGMNEENAYLWNAQKPIGSPEDTEGEWIEVVYNDKNEEYFNEQVLSDGKSVLFARYTRDKRSDVGGRTSLDNERYRWIMADCKSNRYSLWHPTGERFFTGFWMSPKSARPRSSVSSVRRKYCSSPNVAAFETLDIPTVRDLRQFAD